MSNRITNQNFSDDNCSLTKKAYNVRSRGGRTMLLSTRNFNKIDERNFDDNLGLLVDIPTVIIKADDGERIKVSLEQSKTVLISIKYGGVKSGEDFNMEMYLRSDDIKSLHFFNEFGYYYDRLSK